jgi:hypothetical protein
MKKTLLALAAVATLSAGFALPANAAPRTTVMVDVGGPGRAHDRDWRSDHRRIGPAEAARIVRGQGFPRVHAVRYAEGRYVIRAERRNGRVFLVTLDARHGHVMAMRPVGFHRY